VEKHYPVYVPMPYPVKVSTIWEKMHQLTSFHLQIPIIKTIVHKNPNKLLKPYDLLPSH
jgi:hypothetical protein